MSGRTKFPFTAWINGCPYVVDRVLGTFSVYPDEDLRCEEDEKIDEEWKAQAERSESTIVDW